MFDGLWPRCVPDDKNLEWLDLLESIRRAPRALGSVDRGLERLEVLAEVLGLSFGSPIWRRLEKGPSAPPPALVPC